MRIPVNTRALAHLVNYLTTFIYKYIYSIYYHEKFTTL